MITALTEPQAALLWSHLNVLTRERYEAIIKVFGSLGEAAAYVDEEFLRRLGCREDTARNALLRMEEFSAERVEAALHKKNIRFLLITDEAYPARLDEIGDAPPFLYVRGDLSILDQPCIGLVGTRAMSPYGRRVTREFVEPLVRAGMITVSGLALGVDAEVAEETLKVGGRTVAVLGHGLGMIYPKENEKLAERIVESGGLLVSEHPLGMQPDKYTFPGRNRIIAGLSVGTVVLEAPAESGAVITADLALEYSRDVFAVPGPIFDPNYVGCNSLIARDRARLVTSGADVLRHLGIAAREEGSTVASESTYEAQSPMEEALLKALTAMPQRVDELMEKTGLDAGTVASALTMMELGGGARNTGGGMWVRS